MRLRAIAGAGLAATLAGALSIGNGAPAHAAGPVGGIQVRVPASPTTPQRTQQTRPNFPAPGQASEREASALYAEARERLDRQQATAAIGLLELIVQRYPNAAIAGLAAKDLSRLKASDNRAAPVSDPAPPAAAPVTARKDANSTNQSARIAFEFRMAAGDRIFFGDGSFDIGGRARGALEMQAEWLQLHPSVPVVVEGHADDRGTREFNEQIALRRAEVVRQRLIDLGVAAARLTAVGAAREKPVAPCADPSCAAQNRRVVTIAGLQRASALVPGRRAPAAVATAVQDPAPVDGQPPAKR